MKNYGIKIAKSGKSILSTDVRDLEFSSKFSMLKYHKELIGTVTFTPGDTTQSVDFEHQLGYVPAFISYYKETNGQHYFLSAPYAVDYTSHAWSYADSLKVRCGFTFDVGAYNQYDNRNIIGGAPNKFTTLAGGINGWFVVGGDNAGSGSMDGAYRFPSVDIAQGTNIISATLWSKVTSKGSSGSNTEITIYGIDEDDTADFSSSPMGRTKTTASTNESVSLPSVGEFSAHTVTTQLQEIINRAGWSSGNHAGFLFFNNSSPAEAWWADADDNSYLIVTYGGNSTLTFRTIIFKNKIA